MNYLGICLCTNLNLTLVMYYSDDFKALLRKISQHSKLSVRLNWDVGTKGVGGAPDFPIFWQIS